MRISKELQDQRNALRPTTQRKAHALMNEIEQARQKAAARCDREEAFYLADQIKNIAAASTLADFDAVNNAEIAWNKRKEAQKTDAEKAIEAKKPVANPQEILNRKRRIEAHGKLELDRIEREKMKAIKGE